MSVSQIPVIWSRQRLCPSSFVLAGITGFVLWVAIADLLGQGRLETVLSAGRAELAAPLLVALVVVTGICERIWPAERRPVLARGHVQDACFLALHAIVVIPLSPAYHRLHHAPDTQGVNLGVVLTIWDALVGRARFPSRGQNAGRTGLDRRPVPVEQDDSSGFALLLLAEQLIEPFQAQR